MNALLAHHLVTMNNELQLGIKKNYKLLKLKLQHSILYLRSKIKNL